MNINLEVIQRLEEEDLAAEYLLSSMSVRQSMISIVGMMTQHLATPFLFLFPERFLERVRADGEFGGDLQGAYGGLDVLLHGLVRGEQSSVD
jgi:hypothetical protein|tara:strand:+ start:3480 stop:3755 length:276 start_codon:yes stop_codon:yes gene_type:complete